MPWSLGAVPPGYDPRTIRRVQRPKDPADLTVYAADFSGAMDAAIRDDTIVNVIGITLLRNDNGTDSFVQPVPPQVTDGRRVIVWLGGGTTGYEYLVSIRINSLQGQNLSRSFIVPVMGR